MECLNLRYLSKIDQYVPCGKCAFCLATRRSDWSTRLQYEAKLHVDKYFVTLTYADAHLVWRSGIPQLHKKHLQDWFRLVRRAGYKIRYYAVGEYGSKTMRPHYHILLFGSVPEKVIRDSWQYGQVHVGKVTVKSVNYCLKYVVNSKGKGMRKGRIAPWATMSRKPGLGANYLTPAMLQWHRSDRKNYCLVDGQKCHLPRYYKSKIFSKIDHVRIAVRDGKKALATLRAKLYAHRRMRDPMAYVAEQQRIAAIRILDKHRKHLTI